MLNEAQLLPDPVLTAQGWERRFVADGARAKEAIDLYQQLGFEVRAEPVGSAELGDDCDDAGLSWHSSSRPSIPVAKGKSLEQQVLTG